MAASALARPVGSGLRWVSAYLLGTTTLPIQLYLFPLYFGFARLGLIDILVGRNLASRLTSADFNLFASLLCGCVYLRVLCVLGGSWSKANPYPEGVILELLELLVLLELLFLLRHLTYCSEAENSRTSGTGLFVDRCPSAAAIQSDQLDAGSGQGATSPGRCPQSLFL